MNFTNRGSEGSSAQFFQGAQKRWFGRSESACVLEMVGYGGWRAHHSFLDQRMGPQELDCRAMEWGCGASGFWLPVPTIRSGRDSGSLG